MSNLYSIAVMGPIWERVRQREREGFGSFNQGTITVPELGACLAYGRSHEPRFSTDCFSIRALQDWLEGACIAFAPADIDPPTNDFENYTLASWRAAAGIHPGGFRRKAPRSFGVIAGDFTTTTDAYGNSVSEGAIGYGLREITSFSSPGTAGDHAFFGTPGNVLRCVTSGSWTTATTGYSEVQTIRILGGVPSSGTFTLTFAGSTTTALNYNATASQVGSALATVLTPLGLSASVTGSALPSGTITVTFSASRPLPKMTVASSSINAGTVTVARTVHGHGRMADCGGKYRYESGVWVPHRATSTTPAGIDVLDSAEGTLPYGVHQPMDYLFDGLRDEIEAGLAKLTRTIRRNSGFATVVGPRWNTKNNLGLEGSLSSQEAADASWSFSRNQTLLQAISNNVSRGSSADNLLFSASRWQPLAYRIPASVATTRTVNFYFNVEADVFEPMGDNVVLGLNVLTGGGTTAALDLATTYGDISSTPTWPPTPTTNHTNRIAGYSLFDINVVTDWDFT
ncbi:MAG TPA: hypothetical protein VGN72_07855 [Tepidisphaeraceae bacterium]|jgi:hypothetical protein|nr:hypothetical protein [Tepidisphaeraceae bacterium]